MKPTGRRKLPSRKYPRIFVSHRHKDRDIAKALVNMLETAFHIEREDIRCTSVQPYCLPAGSRTGDRLRADIHHAELVLGIVTPDSGESSYVNFELGASWGQEIRCVPLLAKGASSAHIPSPISDVNAVDLASTSQCLQFVEQLTRERRLTRRKGFAPQIAEKIADLVRRNRKARGASRGKLPHIRITEPTYGQTVSGRDFAVKGHFDKSPPDGTFRVFITNLSETKIWPQKRVVFHANTHTWESKATLLDHPPGEAQILVARVGDVGKLLYDHYTEVGEKKDVWIPVSGFTPDTKICQKVYVRNGTPK
jgi:hypothetical protein